MKIPVGFSPKLKSIAIGTYNAISDCYVPAGLEKCTFQNNCIITAYYIAI